MAKKPLTREELLAQLETIDNSTEVAKLKSEVSRLTGDVASLTAQRNDLERQVRQYEKNMEAIRQAVGGMDRRARTHGPTDRSSDVTAIAARLTMPHVRIGIDKGTHDPLTGLEYTADTKPVRDLTAGAPKVSKGELERIFPALSGPHVDVTDAAVTLLDADLSALTSALEIAQG